MSGKVIKISDYLKKENLAEYRNKLSRLDRLDLLEEMVRYQDERSQARELTPEIIKKGLILFPLLTFMSETEELKTLTRSYTRHLEHEAEIRGIKFP